MDVQDLSDPGPAVKEGYVARVLLVDDQPMIGEAIRRVLANESDIEFHFCANPADALAQALAIEPTVILQDLVMPDIDGLTLLRRYHDEPRMRNVPIIVLSSKEDARVKRDAFTAGADDYLVKLPDDVELIARVRYHSRGFLNQMQRDAAYTQLSASRQQLVIANADLKSALHERMVAEVALQQRNGELVAVNRKLEDAHNQLLQSEKMASVGQLAAGVAHEINNPIGYVGSNLSTLQTYLRDIFRLIECYEQVEATLPAANAYLAKINTLRQTIQLPFLREDIFTLLAESAQGVERVARTVKNLREFSHVDHVDWRRVDIHEGIDNTLGLIPPDLAKKAQIVREFGDVPMVECLPFQLNQLFLNLLVNAYEAIEHHGRIVIRTAREGQNARIEIHDDGKGIAAADLKRIFDPFFTTKPVGAGPGLGLSVAYGIVKNHGGTIEATSKPGHGATFIVRLPLARHGARNP